MLIQINTDNNVDSGDQLTKLVENGIETALGSDAMRITRVDVHFGDESAGRKTGSDMKCMIEVRPANHEPVVVTEHASTTDEAFSGAVDKMQHLLGSLFGKLDDRHPGAPSRP
jgi:ribosome-associated translation inhibitor RaiA